MNGHLPRFIFCFLTAHIYYVMIIVTGGFSKKSFLIIFRTSRTQMFFKTGVIRNFAIDRKTSMLESLFNFISTSSQEGLQHWWYLWKLWNFYEQLFLWKTSGGCSCQLDKVTVQWWTSASAGLLFLIKNKIFEMASTKKVCRSGQSMLFTHY